MAPYENSSSPVVKRLLFSYLGFVTSVGVCRTALRRSNSSSKIVVYMDPLGCGALSPKLLRSEEQGGRLGDVCIAFLRPPAASEEEPDFSLIYS